MEKKERFILKDSFFFRIVWIYSTDWSSIIFKIVSTVSFNVEFEKKRYFQLLFFTIWFYLFLVILDMFYPFLMGK